MRSPVNLNTISPSRAPRGAAEGAPPGPGRLAPLAPPHPGATIGEVILLVYVFLRFSMINELVIQKIGFPTYVNYLLVPPLIVLALWSGRLASALTVRPGVLLTGFVVWMALSSPFGFWPGDSITLWFDYLRVSYLLYIAIACLVVTPVIYQRLMASMALATSLILVTSFTTAADAERFRLSYGAMLANPNDLATHLLFLFPACLFILLERKRSSVLWWATLSTILLLIGVVLRTGSRSGLLALTALLLVIWLYLSLPKKMILAGAAVVLGSIYLATVDPLVLQRYRLLWEDPQDVVGGEDGVVSPTELDSTRAAVASADHRKYQMERAFAEARMHPVFGTGPGQFMNAEGQQASEEGKRASWVGAHNTYLEVAAEMGFPGLLLHCGVLLVCFRRLSRIRKATRGSPELRSVHNMSTCLLLAILSYSTTTVFCHVAYKMYVPVLVGLTVAVMRFAEPLMGGPNAPRTAPALAGSPDSEPRRPAPIGLRSPQPRRGSLR